MSGRRFLGLVAPAATVALLLLVLATPSASGEAATSQRAATLQHRMAVVNREITDLQHLTASKPYALATRSQMLHECWRIVHLNRDLLSFIGTGKLDGERTAPRLQAERLQRAVATVDAKILSLGTSPKGSNVSGVSAAPAGKRNPGTVGSLLRSIDRWARYWGKKPPTSTPTPTPTPTPTAKPSPTPSSIPTPKPTPTPTPSPTPTPTPPAPPGATTISGQSFVAYVVPSGQHDVVYESCTFTASGAQDAALLINPGSASATNYNLTFRGCTFQSSQWNAVSVNDWSGNVHDITFQNSHVLTSGRMGFEITTQGTPGASMHDIRLLGVVIDPVGWEPISFDGGNGGGSAILVNGCTIHGGNTNDSFGGGGAFEINGASGVTFSNSTIYAPRYHAFNLNGVQSGGGSAQTSGWVFDNITVDYGQSALGSPANPSSGDLMAAHHMQGALVRNCSFNTGTAANHAQWGVWLDNSSNNDFAGTTISGVVANALTLESGSSSGNTLPTVR